MKIGRYLEAVFGRVEMLRFIIVVNAIIGCSTFVIMVVFYVLFRYEFFL